MSESNHIKRLQWQCRRGIKEVEVLLLPYFSNHYPNLNQEDQQLFERLLNCHDVELFEWFTGRSKPEDKEIMRLVNVILQSVGA